MDEYRTAGIGVLCLGSGVIGRARVGNVQGQVVMRLRLMPVDRVDALGRTVVALALLGAERIETEINRIGFDDLALMQELENAPALDDHHTIDRGRVLCAHRV